MFWAGRGRCATGKERPADQLCAPYMGAHSREIWVHLGCIGHVRTAHAIHDRSDSHNVRSTVLPELLLQLAVKNRRQAVFENTLPAESGWLSDD